MIHAVTEESGHLYIYLHGYRRARLVRLLPPETRVCITATLLDGLALALSAFSSSINHRSAILHGEVVAFDGEDDDTEEKQKVYDAKYEAGRQIVEKVMPGRWDHARQPSKAEMATTGFLKIRVLSGSAKCRAGQPGEERRDMLDEELIQSTWAGVVPSKSECEERMGLVLRLTGSPRCVRNARALRLQCRAAAGVHC
jgi:nitroimidazol reductase NimA-like FMN-containing flavoprotein (pyridoxamine 5'-phosphate oxidase superfamily)